jgi:hypothetical protein
MPVVLGKSHVINKACFQMTLTSFCGAANNLQLQQMFNSDCTEVFMYDEFSEDEVILKKGTTDLAHPENGCFFILNRTGFMEVYLADINGSNWLVFRSVNQIFRTKRRKLYAPQYNKATNVITLLTDSLPEPMELKTSEANFHTDPSNFTGININNTDDLEWGRGTIGGFPDSFGTLYVDIFRPWVMTQDEINTIYQTWQDTRIPEVTGKIIFSTDRLGNGFDLFEMNPDGTDPILLKGGAEDLTNPKYTKQPTTDLDYIFQQGFKQVIYDNPSNGFIEYLDPCLDGSFSSDSSRLYSIQKSVSRSSGHYYVSGIGAIYYPLTYAPYGNGSTNIFSLDANPIINNKIAVVFFHVNDSVFSIAEIDLNFSVQSNSTASVIFQLSYTQNFGDSQIVPSIFGIKYNKQGTKIGFNAYVNDGYTNLHGFIMDITGENIVDLGANIQFVSFSPDGNSLLLKKTISRLVSGVPTDFTQLFTRNLINNKEVNISNNLWNDKDGDWK